jgi:DNA replication and repair protein RecF
MYLQSIVLRQFRNHRFLDLKIHSGVNLFLGSNGAGKTNLIEAVAVLATGVSPRGADSESLVQWGENGFSILGRFGYEDPLQTPVALEMKYKIGSSRVVRQDDAAVRLRDLIGKVPIVSFVPEDLSLVKGEPDLRRRALNMVLAQVDSVYADALRKYTEAVKSRNAALRQWAQGEITRQALEPWDNAVIEWGLVLCQKRAEFIENFSTRVSFVQQRISGGKETLQLEYRPSFSGPWDDGAADRWKSIFKQMEPQEIATGTTLVGPHRDDMAFVLNDRSARAYGSEGQKRTCAVAFKLAEIPFIQDRSGQRPICLLDDVLSELDAERASHLLEELSRTGQCLVTMTGLESWPRQFPLPATIFRVDDMGINLESDVAYRADDRNELSHRPAEGLSLSSDDISEVFSNRN